MQNELILIASLLFSYGMVFIFYKTLGKTGLFVWTAIATIVANIEVPILINAFGMEQTLGNVLFASTFLVTDILSENHDKKSANTAVKIGVLASITFIVLSRFWFVFTPSENDFIMPAMKEVFSNTPRIMIAGVVVYAVCQLFDVWVYHRIWQKTTEKFGDSKKYLFIRNNVSTMLSQLINSFLFNFAAFYGTMDNQTIIYISLSTYVIYFITSLLDTPIVYLARRFKPTEEKA